MDALDLALVAALREHPRAGDLELSRVVKVARATVQSRLAKMEAAGVITGYGPDVDLTAAGHPVLAFATLEIAQGRLEDVRAELDSLPNVLEAYVTSGTADVVCKIAASSHADLQDVLLHMSTSGSIVRSTSIVVLSELVAPRVLPVLARDVQGGGRAPRYR
ncbi:MULTISPECIES: Lrp/AsnC family transcriptional regulator [unclassified Aeromicrobium]|jgi:DNA-binding Lrp family transcriptional regulator|uniref:Lrp/AsnC family transcriptional regulator n=1 Tax=unclassified Aeromicrobium TaxID=2633570 RepID=UPI0006FEF66D|nr:MULTISPECIES: Lrp/AsnC family transcriptional regulator [unclassified Aeromicrobium]KQO42100.1 AsnC family transcriptional regulator [Aeromicrobium sp. Leaf245]KQP29355.1 AsnC family transcriptional regulator [Aeromicrobium sp. Leaf272]KQP81470.1 AsnC family transcriptional regulator [Aeromicrobium sp. Leaf291]RYY46178.1 MAG: Lrp/AsnC family transcriptional regulator [Actinomycetales bacterium]